MSNDLDVMVDETNHQTNWLLDKKDSLWLHFFWMYFKSTPELSCVVVSAALNWWFRPFKRCDDIQKAPSIIDTNPVKGHRDIKLEDKHQFAQRSDCPIIGVHHLTATFGHFQSFADRTLTNFPHKDSLKNIQIQFNMTNSVKT